MTRADSSSRPLRLCVKSALTPDFGSFLRPGYVFSTTSWVRFVFFGLKGPHGKNGGAENESIYVFEAVGVREKPTTPQSR
jgi:hypothetical protein